MLELHLPWLELAIATPLVGAMIVWRVRDAQAARRRTLQAMAITLLVAVGAWEDFSTLHVFAAHDHWSLLPDSLNNAIVIDELSAPLLPLAALLFLLTTLATPRTKIDRFPFGWNLFSLAVVLSMLCCKDPWGVIALLLVQAIPPAVELHARGRSVRVFVLHMAVSVGLLAAGWTIISADSPGESQSLWGVAMLIGGVLVRSGAVPVHCWMTDLFENATFGTALLFVAPMAGAYAGVRLLLPVAPEWALHAVAVLSLLTAVYAAAMALVQREARRFFVYLFLSHASLVLIGLEAATPIGLSGGLCVWLSVGMSLAGLGLTLRALEARTGRLSLDDYHGLYDHMPTLAGFFLLTGLSSIGFPGTVGFVGMELLFEGAIDIHPWVGVLLVLAAALNGIAIMHAYFRLFTGTHHTASVSLAASWQERAAVLVLTLLIVGGGLVPQPGVHSRYHAAVELLAQRDDSMQESIAQQEISDPAKPKTLARIVGQPAVCSEQRKAILPASVPAGAVSAVHRVEAASQLPRQCPFGP